MPRKKKVVVDLEAVTWEGITPEETELVDEAVTAEKEAAHIALCERVQARVTKVLLRAAEEAEALKAAEAAVVTP